MFKQEAQEKDGSLSTSSSTLMNYCREHAAGRDKAATMITSATRVLQYKPADYTAGVRYLRSPKSVTSE